MTAKPVPEHISDERLAELRSYARLKEDACLRDEALLTAKQFSDFGRALTELQHRREAEAGISEALRNEIVGIIVTNSIGGTDDFPAISLAGVIGDLSDLAAASPSSPASGVRVSVEGILEMLETAQRLRDDHLPNSTQQAHLWEKKAGHAVRELIAREATGEPFGPVYWPDELRKALGGYRAAHLSALGEHP